MFEKEYLGNRKVHYIGVKPRNLRLVISLAMTEDYATGWSLDQDFLVFHWGGDYTNFPCALSFEEVFTVAHKWLQLTKPSMAKPNLDGSSRAGFELISESLKDNHELFRVRPIWAIYHK